MILSFKPQFKEAIQLGVKIHTIREDPHDRWQPGTFYHMATGVRTKNYNCFATGNVISIQEIEMTWMFPDYLVILIDGKEIEDWDLLAKNDGFGNFQEFLSWPDWKGKDFIGKLIHWTDYKY